MGLDINSLALVKGMKCAVPTNHQLNSNPTHKGGGVQEERELHTLYAMKEEIGRGGFGVVYAAERKSNGLEVAIKEVLKGIGMITEDNFPLEVDLMQQVNDVP